MGSSLLFRRRYHLLPKNTELKELRHKAVEYGYATYEVNKNEDPVFNWYVPLRPAEKEEPKPHDSPKPK